MKVAVYGDSHVDYHLDKSINSELSWLEILSENYDITSFAQAGSGMYYSYKMFLESHKDFDKIIFFATANNRLFIEHLEFPFNHITSIQMAQRYLIRNDLSDYERKSLIAMVDYYTYIFNATQCDIYRNLMISDIMIRCPNAIIFDLINFYSQESEIKFYGRDHTTVFHDYLDLRHCHFSQERNIVLADMIKTSLETNSNKINYDIIHSTNPSKSFDEYFVKYDSKRYDDVNRGRAAVIGSREILKKKNNE